MSRNGVLAYTCFGEMIVLYLMMGEGATMSREFGAKTSLVKYLCEALDFQLRNVPEEQEATAQ
jgi:hypothetical protein